MKKRFLTSAVCMALSATMMLGTVSVGAAQNEVTKNISKTTASVVAKDATGVTMKAPEITSKSAMTTNMKKLAQSTVLWNANNWNNFMKGNFTPVKEGYTCISPGYCKVGEVKITQNGNVFVFYEAVCQTSSSTYGIDLSLRSLDGKKTYEHGSKGLVYGANLKAGTYGLYTLLKKDYKVAVAYASASTSNKSYRWLGTTPICVAATGNNNYQYFKMSKRGIVTTSTFRKYRGDGNYGVSHYIQKKSGSYWKTVTNSTYSSSYDNFADVYGLSAGTYRLVTKVPVGYDAFLAVKKNYYDSSYGTKKSKAKTISRKKSKSNTILTTDSTKTSHWYKVKVTSTRNTYIDVTSLGTSGKISSQIYGKTRLKSKTIKNGTRFYGKAKKGTYYIKISRYTKSVSGAYRVKYTK